MTKRCGICLAMLLLATAAYAGARIDGKITAIDAEKGTLEISGVTVITKDAKLWDLIFPSRLSRLRVGWGVEATGTFTGPREFTATQLVAKYFRHYEIQAKVDAGDVRARTLSISGITVKIPADCTFEDENGDETTLEKLPVGRKMEVEGDWTGPAEFTCYSIEVWKEKKEECPAGDRKS